MAIVEGTAVHFEVDGRDMMHSLVRGTDAIAKLALGYTARLHHGWPLARLVRGDDFYMVEPVDEEPGVTNE